MERVLLTTGGTGGHIFPALAVAEDLRLRHPGVELLFVGSQYGPEQRLARAAGIDFIGLPVRGFLGRGLRAFAAAGRMACAVCRARGIIRRFRPQVVAGFGGYAAFAPMLAARLAGVPTVLHEQNAIAGMSNRILGRLARRICLSLPGTEGFDASRPVLPGNPVRAAVVALAGRRPGGPCPERPCGPAARRLAGRGHRGAPPDRRARRGRDPRGLRGGGL